ncbi:MAG TPA: hypothetical protein G4O00_13645 [Thermoflexia bacterium]|jgi:hypothetical protein|nr:hypothetical protein [Thermoflexia bacterium]
MTALEWFAWLVLLIVALAAGLAVTLSNGAVTRAIRRLERTYRRQKSLELEQLQAQVVERRMQEVQRELAANEGWRKVLNQVLADALKDTSARVGPVGVLSLTTDPAPAFTVAGEDGREYLFTTAPDVLEQVGWIGRKAPVIPLDASLHPAARAEVQAVWDHLAEQRLRGEVPTLPRQAEWFLVVRERKEQDKPARR